MAFIASPQKALEKVQEKATEKEKVSYNFQNKGRHE